MPHRNSGLKILFEDENVLAAAKPAGIVVHPDEHHKTNTLIDAIVALRPEIKKVGEKERPGIVHRLDKDTSGVLLIAKTQNAWVKLKQLFKDGKIQKEYVALVAGIVKDDKGVVEAPIARSTKHFEKRVVGGGSGVKRSAVTEYAALERFGGEYTLLRIHPKTGRTHQIRSHLKYIGHPVACDKLYGGKRFVCPAGLDRQFLHALSVEFSIEPGKLVSVEAPLPDDLEAVLKRLRKGM